MISSTVDSLFGHVSQKIHDPAWRVRLILNINTRKINYLYNARVENDNQKYLFYYFFLLHFLKIWACAAHFWEGGEGLGGERQTHELWPKEQGRDKYFFTKAPSAPPSAWSLSIRYSIILFKVGLNQTKQVFLTMIKFTFRPSRNIYRWWASIGGVIERAFHAA